MRQAMPRTRWQRWRRALVFGLPLGVLELGLIYITITHSYWLSPPQATLIGWLLALLIPGIAAYHYCYWGRHADSASGWEGLRVGVVGAIVVMVGSAVWLVVTLIAYENTPPPPAPGSRFYSQSYAQSYAVFFAVLLLGLLAMINFVGLAFSAASGRVGEALANRRIKRIEARGQCD